MKSSFFAISMGFINLNTPNLLNPQKQNIYSSIMREIVKKYLDLGAKIYLQYPVEYIETEGDILEIIGQRGYCIMSFESELSLFAISGKAKSTVKSFGTKLVNPLGPVQDDKEGLLQHFEECFEPYWVSKYFDFNFPIDEILEVMTSQISERIKFGRRLKMKSKPSIEYILTKASTSSVLV